MAKLLELEANKTAAQSDTPFIWDDLDMSRLTDAQEATVRNLLQELGRSLNMTSVLARDIADSAKLALKA